MKTIQVKTLFIAFLLSIVAPSLLAEMNQAQMDLFQALQEGNLAGVEQAFASGADVDERDELGWTVLMHAARGDNPEVIAFLIENNAAVNKRNNNDETALMFAKSPEVAKLLIENGAEVDEVNWNGETALMGAAEGGRLELAKLLLEKGASIDAQSKAGRTALIYAAMRYDNPEIAELLLEWGVDIAVKDKYGETALEIAKRSGKTGIVKVIRSFSVIDRLAITEEQRQKFAKEQDGIDPISMDDITKESLDKLMILEKYIFLRKTIMDHMISKVGSDEGILDPFTRKPIPAGVQYALLDYFGLPSNLLKEGGPIHQDAEDLQQRENWIVMTGEPETEKEKEELKELENEAAEFRKRIRDTLASYNYSSTE